jgi:hypothetical protein
MTARARLRIDPIACDGRGLCAEILPELIALDDWGYPVIRGDDYLRTCWRRPGKRYGCARGSRYGWKRERADLGAGAPAGPEGTGRKGKDVVCVISSEVLAAGPLFFVSAWLLMIFAGIVATDVGIRPFGYITSMVVTIGLWLTLAPAIGAIARTRRKD